jgi:hypothetical protein
MKSAKGFVHWVMFVIAVVLVPGLSCTSAAEPLLKSGDTIVFLGGQTTQAGVYTRYVMNYLSAQHPDWMVSYRNAGLVGDDECNRTPGGLKRIERDVFGQHPTWVVLAFGMDDPRYKPYDQATFDEFMRGLNGMLDALAQRKVKALLVTPWCVSPNFKNDKIDGTAYNAVLKRYADAIQQVGASRKLPVADVYTPSMAMLDAASKAGVAPDTLFPNPVMPSPAVHAVIALTIAQTLCGEPPGSSAVIDAGRRGVKQATLCKVTDLAAAAGTFSFRRTDKVLPGFIDGEAIGPVASYFPAASQINPYRVQVTGLDEGTWKLTVAGQKIGAFTAAELAAGVNLANHGGPWRQESARINTMSTEGEELYKNYWWNVLTAHTWWLPQEAEPERAELQEAMLKAMTERDKKLCSVAAGLPAWEWTLTRQAAK